MGSKWKTTLGSTCRSLRWASNGRLPALSLRTPWVRISANLSQAARSACKTCWMLVAMKPAMGCSSRWLMRKSFQLWALPNDSTRPSPWPRLCASRHGAGTEQWLHRMIAAALSRTSLCWRQLLCLLFSALNKVLGFVHDQGLGFEHQVTDGSHRAQRRVWAGCSLRPNFLRESLASVGVSPGWPAAKASFASVSTPCLTS